MNFRKSKTDVMNDVRSIVNNNLYGTFDSLKYNSHNITPAQALDNMKWAIEKTIVQALESIVNNTYTDEEFEQDLNLRDKI